MNEKSVSHTRIQEFLLGDPGLSAENDPDIFLVINFIFYILQL